MAEAVVSCVTDLLKNKILVYPVLLALAVGALYLLCLAFRLISGIYNQFLRPPVFSKYTRKAGSWAGTLLALAFDVPCIYFC